MPGPPTEEGRLTGLLYVTGVWVTDGASPVPAMHWMGHIVGEHPDSGRPPTLSGILTKDDRVGGVTH